MEAGRHQIGIVGGTGSQGQGLAIRLASAGFTVRIGGRSATRAAVVAAELGRGVRGMSNAEAAAESTVVIVAVPWDGHADTLEALRPHLAGKVVVDCVNPLGFDQHGAFAIAVPEGSAAQQAAMLLPDSTVVAAFHHVSAALLKDSSIDQVETDVLVLGDDVEATDMVQDVVASIPGMRGVYAGRLRNAGPVEALTANLISVNRRYQAHAGIRVTDISPRLEHRYGPPRRARDDESQPD
jgi:8-hydroxy-5-deazaflavin:NADPH oxidoreductase